MAPIKEAGRNSSINMKRAMHIRTRCDVILGMVTVLLLSNSIMTDGYSSSAALSTTQGGRSWTSPPFSFSSSFTQRTAPQRSRSRSRSPGQRSPASTRLTMVLDRLSPSAVSALQTAHAIGNEFGLRVLKNEVITVGTISHPEKAIRTLVKYNLAYPPLAKASASAVLIGNGFQLQRKINKDSMKGVDRQLPFSEEAKGLLYQAGRIADYFEEREVGSEHLLLALMGYNYGKPLDLGNLPVGYNVLVNMELPLTPQQLQERSSDGQYGGFADDGDDDDDDTPKTQTKKAKFSAYEFCEDLVADMASTYDWKREEAQVKAQAQLNEQEVIVVGGGSGSSSTLAEVGVDLTAMAVDGELDLVHGRRDEMRMALRTLGRRRKNNPCLIGDPGVGKTAIAEAIAQVIATSYSDSKPDKKKSAGMKLPGLFNKDPLSGFKASDDDDSSAAPPPEPLSPMEQVLASPQYPPCPPSLSGFRVVSVELASLVAGTRNRGDFEEKIQNLIKEASNSNIILFIDEIHNLIGTGGGGGDGSMNAANLMKPALARGELRVMGATTTPEYRRYIEKDAALERRFQPLDVVEPTVEQTLDILRTILPRYADFHGVEYTPNSLEAAAKLSDRYITDRFLPDKAIDLIDECGSMIKMREDFDEDYFVTEDAINLVVSELTGIPVGRLDAGEKGRLVNLENDMGNRIKGQEQAVKSVAKAIRRARSGMRDPLRPVASFMFCGPTGVGKTELCKSLADTYYGREKDMITIDMSEYMDRFSTSRLVGAPPGYVGYEEGGQLTEAVRRNPHSVVLFDEVEKAHEDVLNVLLQIMDEGKLTDGKGRTVNFKNTIFVMTSNIGSANIVEFSKQNNNVEPTTETYTKMADLVKEELEKKWKPEILNRIDEIIVFNSLSAENLRAIASNILDKTAVRAAEAQGIALNVADDVAVAVTKDGMEYASQYGARPIRRASQRYLEDTMAEAIMKDFIQEGDEVTVAMANPRKFSFRKLLSKGQDVVQISKISNTGSRDSIMVPVELPGGIGSSVRDDLEWQALYGDDGSTTNQEDDPSFQ